MRLSRRLIALTSLLTLWQSVGCSAASDGSPDHESHEPTRGNSFYELLEYTHVTPVPKSLADVVADSSAIAIGKFSDVQEGRIIDFRDGASHPVFTAVFELRVQESVRGDDSGHLYAEYWRAPVADVQSFRNSLPRETFVFVLEEPAWDETTYRFENPDAGVPDGARLHAFNFPFGMIAEGAAGLEYPLMSDTPKEVFASKTIETLVQEIESLGAP